MAMTPEQADGAFVLIMACCIGTVAVISHWDGYCFGHTFLSNLRPPQGGDRSKEMRVMIGLSMAGLSAGAVASHFGPCPWIFVAVFVSAAVWGCLDRVPGDS